MGGKWAAEETVGFVGYLDHVTGRWATLPGGRVPRGVCLTVNYLAEVCALLSVVLMFTFCFTVSLSGA